MPEDSDKLSLRISCLHGDGGIRVITEYTPVSGKYDLPEFGTLFKLKPSMSISHGTVPGPPWSYSDRLVGAKIDFYSGKVSERLASTAVHRKAQVSLWYVCQAYR